MARWKVVHQFSEGIFVQNPTIGYPSIGVSLYYDGNKLMRVEHELEVDDELEPYRVVDTSRDALDLFWELLRYRRGISLPSTQRTASKIKPVDNSQPIGVGFADVTTRVAICLPVVMPDPSLFSHANSRLLVWLRLWNDASDSDSATDAIRNYYMILEDMYSDRKDNMPTEVENLKLVRHLVSHGNKPHRETREFVEKHLGKSIEKFDPTDKAQQQFIRSWRTSARNLVEMEINKRLGQ